MTLWPPCGVFVQVAQKRHAACLARRILRNNKRQSQSTQQLTRKRILPPFVRWGKTSLRIAGFVTRSFSKILQPDARCVHASLAASLVSSEVHDCHHLDIHRESAAVLPCAIARKRRSLRDADVASRRVCWRSIEQLPCPAAVAVAVTRLLVESFLIRAATV